MNCYVCNLSGTVRPAVGVCRHCSAALCNEHFKEAQAFAVGGTTAYCCPHPIESPNVREGQQSLARAN